MGRWSKFRRPVATIIFNDKDGKPALVYKLINGRLSPGGPIVLGVPAKGPIPQVKSNTDTNTNTGIKTDTNDTPASMKKARVRISHQSVVTNTTYEESTPNTPEPPIMQIPPPPEGGITFGAPFDYDEMKPHFVLEDNIIGIDDFKVDNELPAGILYKTEEQFKIDSFEENNNYEKDKLIFFFEDFPKLDDSITNFDENDSN